MPVPSPVRRKRKQAPGSGEVRALQLLDGITDWGLSLSSGGAATAWTAGFLENVVRVRPAMLLRIRAVCGSSGGALAAAALGHAILEQNVWPLVRLIEGFRSVCEYGLSRIILEDLIATCVTDDLVRGLCERVTDENFPLEVGCCAVSLADYKARIFTTATKPSPERFRSWLLASAAIPGVIGPVRFDPGGPEWVDGAVGDVNPVGFVGWCQVARRLQAVMRLDVHGSGRPTFSPRTPVFLTLPAVGSRLVNRALASAARNVLGVPVTSNEAGVVAGILGSLLLPENSNWRPAVEAFTAGNRRGTMAIPVVGFRPLRALPLHAGQFEEDLVREAAEAGRRAAQRYFT